MDKSEWSTKIKRKLEVQQSNGKLPPEGKAIHNE